MKDRFTEMLRSRGMYLALTLTGLLILAWSPDLLAAGGGEHSEGGGANMKEFMFKVINFAILVGLLWWLLAKKVKEFFVGRRASIRTEIDDTEAQKAEARKKFDEYSSRLTKMTDEISGIAEIIKAQGQAEKDKIIADAKKAAEKMQEDTKARMEQEFQKGSAALRLEAAQLAVEMAEEILKKNITAQDHNDMVRDYLDKVVTKH
ncbi:MAG: ATP synthase F0 subunit B [Syntrophaceae bacterium]|nr:ATP synthase F0 subunit B [Syntrophaceae bacterium]